MSTKPPSAEEIRELGRAGNFELTPEEVDALTLMISRWVPTLERVDAAGAPAYLENSNPRNTPLYQRHGFVARKNIAPHGCPPMVAMWRNGSLPPPSAGSAGRSEAKEA